MLLSELQTINSVALSLLNNVMTSKVSGFVNEWGDHQQGTMLFAKASRSLLQNQLKVRVLPLDVQTPGGYFLLHLCPALLFVLLTYERQNREHSPEKASDEIQVALEHVWLYFYPAGSSLRAGAGSGQDWNSSKEASEKSSTASPASKGQSTHHQLNLKDLEKWRILSRKKTNKQ